MNIQYVHVYLQTPDITSLLTTLQSSLRQMSEKDKVGRNCILSDPDITVTQSVTPPSLYITPTSSLYHSFITLHHSSIISTSLLPHLYITPPSSLHHSFILSPSLLQHSILYSQHDPTSASQTAEVLLSG